MSEAPERDLSAKTEDCQTKEDYCVCGIRFTAERASKKFCSDRCRFKAARRRMKDPTELLLRGGAEIKRKISNREDAKELYPKIDAIMEKCISDINTALKPKMAPPRPEPEEEA